MAGEGASCAHAICWVSVDVIKHLKGYKPSCFSYRHRVTFWISNHTCKKMTHTFIITTPKKITHYIVERYIWCTSAQRHAHCMLLEVKFKIYYYYYYHSEVLPLNLFIFDLDWKHRSPTGHTLSCMYTHAFHGSFNLYYYVHLMACMGVFSDFMTRRPLSNKP